MAKKRTFQSTTPVKVQPQRSAARSPHFGSRCVGRAASRLEAKDIMTWVALLTMMLRPTSVSTTQSNSRV
jgi:hypothetical protein